MSENNREWFDEELYFVCLYSFFVSLFLTSRFCLFRRYMFKYVQSTFKFLGRRHFILHCFSMGFENGCQGPGTS